MRLSKGIYFPLDSTGLKDEVPHPSLIRIFKVLLIPGPHFFREKTIAAPARRMAVGQYRWINTADFDSGLVACPPMYHEAVMVRDWMDETLFLDGIAIVQVTPGHIIITATFRGFAIAGMAGELIVTVGIFIGSFSLTGGLYSYFDRRGNPPSSTVQHEDSSLIHRAARQYQRECSFYYYMGPDPDFPCNRTLSSA